MGTINVFFICRVKIKMASQAQRPIPLISATWESGIRIEIGGQPGQKVTETRF
jgi:hypothetical protein